MPKFNVQSRVMDANESAFFEAQLKFIMAEALKVQYPENTALRLFPKSFEGGAGAAEIAYRLWDVVGMPKLIANNAKDIPRIDIKGEEFVARVKSWAAAYGIHLQEIRYALQAGVALQSEKATATREVCDRFINNLAWRGDSVANIQGLLYHPNVTKGNATTGDWGNNSTTAALIVQDITNAINNMITLTGGAERPTFLGLPPEAYTYASTKRLLDDGSGRTALEFIQKNQPQLTIEMVPELAGLPTVPSTGAAGPVDVMVLANLRPDKFVLSIPVPFEQLPPQEVGLEQVVNCHGRTAGIIMKRPLSVSIVQNL